MDEFNTLYELIEHLARNNQEVRPRLVTDTKGLTWLAVDTPYGDHWFWADGTVMQVL